MPTGESLKRYYPGLVPAEEALWRAFLRENEASFDSFEYNVRVGAGAPCPEPYATGTDPWSVKMRDMWRANTQRRIDCLGFQGPECWIFEVEPRAGLTALGQLTAYAVLLPDVRPEIGSVILAVVTGAFEADMAAPYEDSGVIVFVVTPTQSGAV